MIQKFGIDLNIYDREIILEAIDDFQEIANIQFENDNLIIKGDTVKNIEECFCELMNYSIGLMNT